MGGARPTATYLSDIAQDSWPKCHQKAHLISQTNNLKNLCKMSVKPKKDT